MAWIAYRIVTAQCLGGPQVTPKVVRESARPESPTLEVDMRSIWILVTGFLVAGPVHAVPQNAEAVSFERAVRDIRETWCDPGVVITIVKDGRSFSSVAMVTQSCLVASRSPPVRSYPWHRLPRQ